MFRTYLETLLIQTFPVPDRRVAICALNIGRVVGVFYATVKWPNFRSGLSQHRGIYGDTAFESTEKKLYIFLSRKPQNTVSFIKPSTPSVADKKVFDSRFPTSTRSLFPHCSNMSYFCSLSVQWNLFSVYCENSRPKWFFYAKKSAPENLWWSLFFAYEAPDLSSI